MLLGKVYFIGREFMKVRKIILTFLKIALDASSLAFASLIQQCYWGKSLLLDGRKVNRNRKIFMVAGASSPLFGISWLKIEPRSQFFLVIKATSSVAFITATMKIFLFLSTYKFFKFIPYQFY